MAAAAKKDPDLGSAVSRLTWLECRVGTMTANDNAALAAFDAFLARPDLVWVEMTRDVEEFAVAIRVGQRNDPSPVRRAMRHPDLHRVIYFRTRQP